MNFSIRSKRPFAILLAFVLFFIAALPVQAAETASKQVEVRVKVGSGQMSVNGETIKIQPPYNAGKIAMVPLSVFTNAKGFGATLKPSGKNIQLAYLKHKLVLTKGSKVATFDGKKATLPVAPVDKAGVTMVPLDAIAKALGLKQSTDAKTKELVLKGASATAAPAGNGIDSDAGKNKIGDSYYKWSMNYPTGLVQDTQSENGDSLVFRDVKKEYYLGIFVEEAEEDLTTTEKRERLQAYVQKDETVMDKRTVNVSLGVSYEKIVTKNKSGFFYEQRGIQANKQFYVIIFGKKASSIAELSKETGILDSFKTLFNASDKSLKDMTKIIGGFKSLKYEDYGLTLQLPKAWASDPEVTYPYYSNDGAYLWMDVSSPEAGMTTDEWIERKLKRFTDYFSAEYGQVVEHIDVVWNGIPAKAVKLKYSYDTYEWWEEYEIFALNGKYRYYTEFAYTDAMKDKKGITLDQLLKTMKVDFATVEGNFGEIPDEYLTLDRTKTSVKTNVKYKYSMTLPDHWTMDSKTLETDDLDFSFFGGNFTVNVYEGVSDARPTYEDVRRQMNELAAQDSKYRLLESTQTTFAGQTAYKLVVENKNNNDEVTPYHSISYLFVYNGNFYVVEGSYFLANSSTFIVKQLEDAFASFKVN
ncbi:stalk domain-containing protein [Cohnella sp. GCM10027633]|uniref:stalk domain-containing protein n=1 Tax=unclassified Cohnella TaxID=2636738 RepID=UPI0036361350